MRQLYTARLTRKLLLSESAACFHLEFTIEELEKFDFQPGQFVSSIGVDPAGKQQTRAYSLASAPRDNQFDVCVNRVEEGFFSNLLCDLEVGQTRPVSRSAWIVPVTLAADGQHLHRHGNGHRAHARLCQHLFPDNGEDRSQGRKIWLVYRTRYQSELYYEDYFEGVAASRPNFFYFKTLSRAQEEWKGERGYVQELVERIAAANVRKSAQDPGQWAVHL